VGEYQSILPVFDPFEAPPRVQAPPEGQMLGGVSGRGHRAAKFVMSPAAAMLSGTGQTDALSPVPAPPLPVVDRSMNVGWALVVLGVVGYLSYEVGTAMTPPGSKKTNWGLLGIPVGIFTGPIGLGVMAIVSNHGRR
jgi:hypothetical protein